MQTVIQVLCNGKKSLRDVIVSDKNIEGYQLRLISKKRQNRNPGWTKIKGTKGQHGGINIEWSGSSQTLTCRVVTKKPNKPNKIVGNFIDYLIARHSRKIVTVLIFQVK
jgi:hypothetical protein